MAATRAGSFDPKERLAGWPIEGDNDPKRLPTCPWKAEQLGTAAHA